MTLETGTKLGPYQIKGAIGAGGMGEVYRASDTRLGRTVAIKVLPSPQVLFEIPEGIQTFDVTRDGERFIVVVNVVNRYAEPMTVILNWEEKLK